MPADRLKQLLAQVVEVDLLPEALPRLGLGFGRLLLYLLRAFAHAHLQQSRKVNPMVIGTVKFYNDMKGFGFIQPDNGEKDVFVHATALERAGIRGLREGQKVTFDLEDGRKGQEAHQLRVLR